MLNFIKFLAEGGGGLRDRKGLIWSQNPGPFDYQLLIEALNWFLLNTAACEDDGGVIRLDRKWDWVKGEMETRRTTPALIHTCPPQVCRRDRDRSVNSAED